MSQSIDGRELRENGSLNRGVRDRAENTKLSIRRRPPQFSGANPASYRKLKENGCKRIYIGSREQKHQQNLSVSFVAHETLCSRAERGSNKYGI